ncbi:MAG TPA: YraN family protein [Eubacteriaceae bacterium]|jgi:putative endonuclease|nr:YraN family protein [Eubacteriaceae bacterium]
MSYNRDKGAMGESVAVEYLISKKYRILKTNYRSKAGEIDIIASKEEDVVFVEVKTRSTTKYGNPGEAISKSKKRHIIKTAMFYLVENDDFNGNYRFDVIEILSDKINHIKNAFGVNW